MKKTFILSLKIGVYSVCFALSLILSFSLKYAFLIPDFAQKQLLCAITWIVPLKLFFLIISGEFKGIFSYFRWAFCWEDFLMFGMAFLLERSFYLIYSFPFCLFCFLEQVYESLIEVE